MRSDRSLFAIKESASRSCAADHRTGLCWLDRHLDGFWCACHGLCMQHTRAMAVHRRQEVLQCVLLCQLHWSHKHHCGDFSRHNTTRGMECANFKKDLGVACLFGTIGVSPYGKKSFEAIMLISSRVVAAVSAQLYFLNHAPMSDFSYNCWSTALCQQIAQNLAVISACLPCLHPFIIRVLAGTIQPETVSFTSYTPPFMQTYWGHTTTNVDPPTIPSSHGSTTNLTEKIAEHYCRPLATYGLDRSSNLHRHTNSATHFPPNIAKTVFNPRPPPNVFNRPVALPQTRPGTSTSAADPLATPNNLNDVGCLPTIDWDTDSSNSRRSRRNSPARNPTSEYVFNRQQVISVSDENHLYDDGTKQFAPPLPSPGWPKRPPRAF
jgi:hypothetical protein